MSLLLLLSSCSCHLLLLLGLLTSTGVLAGAKLSTWEDVGLTHDEYRDSLVRDIGLTTGTSLRSI